MYLASLFENADPKEGRAEFIRKTLGQKWHSLPGYENLEDFIKAVAKIDPTKKGIYMPWIARLCITRPDQNRAEDLQRMGKDLKIFELNKPKIANKDINSYRSFADLFAAIEPFTKKRSLSAKEKMAQKIAKIKEEGITDVYVGPEGWIKIPTTVQAAKFLGQSTRWCTAANSNNMFSQYNSTDKLFVIYDKAKKQRYQLHINAGQFMDEADSPVQGGWASVPEWARDPIFQWYREHNPKLSLKHLMAFSSMGMNDVAQGTEHEDVFNLMKAYGVI